MPNYFNIFDCGGNNLNRLDVTYEQAHMATTKEKYHTKMLETLVDYNDRSNAPFSNEKFRQVVSKLLTNIIRRKKNHNSFTKILTSKETQIIRQSMRNLQLQIN